MIELNRKKKILNRKKEREKLLKTFIEDEVKKKAEVEAEIRKLEAQVQAEKNKIIEEVPKTNQ